MRSKARFAGAMSVRLLGAVSLVALVAPASLAQEGPSLPAVKWSSLEDAGAAARTQKKPVFVMVYADWCGYCHKMDATTFRNPGIVGRLSSQYVTAKLNGESDKPFTFFKQSMTESQWAQLQGVQGFPALIVVDPKGRTVVQYPGFLDTPTASAFLDELGIFFKAGGIDKLGNFVDWSNKRRG